MTGSSSKQSSSVYDFTVKQIFADGNAGMKVGTCTNRAQSPSVINGLTNSNYTELNEVYTKYKDQGSETLSFPSNQFGGQEPCDNAQIAEVACTRFKAEFLIFDKVEAPLHKFLKSRKGGLFHGGMEWPFGDGIMLNFTKFLVEKHGNVVERYAPTTPLSIIEMLSWAMIFYATFTWKIVF